MASISLCMIARDEEQWLGELLAQTKAYVDEIILVDTGSEDRTKEIAKEHGAKVFDFTWVDDFSKARNESLRHATKDWILVLDADERIAADDLRAIRKLLDDTDASAFFLPQRNYTNNDKIFGWKPNDPEDPLAKGKGHSDNALIRLFANDRAIRFRNPVHEVVDESVVKQGKAIGRLPIPIHHYGNLKDEQALDQKREKYLGISAKQIAQDPTNARPYYEAGRVLKAQGKHKKAAEMLEKAAALKPDYHLVLTNLADSYRHLGDRKRAISTYLRAIKQRPNNENAYINLALVFIDEKKPKEAITLLRRAITVNPSSAAAYNNLSLLLLKQRKPLRAMEVLQEAVSRTGLDRFRQALERLKPKVTALLGAKEKDLKERLAQDPLDLESVTALGHLYFVSDRHQEAAKLFDKTLGSLGDEALTDEHKAPLIYNLYANLSLAQERGGDVRLALDTTHKTLALNPPHKEFFERRVKELGEKLENP